MEMSSIIEELEAASEGSREMDEAIAFQVQWRPETRASKESFAEHERKHDYATAWTAHAPWRRGWPIPAYITSLDAALTLVPEGRLWSIGSIVNGSGFVAILNNDSQSHRGTTPALALCVAALKARQAMEENS